MFYVLRQPQSSLTHVFFRIGMVWRIAYGFVRVALGLTLFRLVGHPLVDAFHYVMSFELAENHKELILSHASNFLERHPVEITTFLAIYFIFWGTVDVIISYALIKDKLWAFHFAYFIMIPFMCYELLRAIKTGSFILLWIVLFDILIIYLIRKEHVDVTTRKNAP